MVQHHNNDNTNIDSMSPSELKAYYRGLKRGINITYATMYIREAVNLNYSRYPQLRFTRGEPIQAAQDLINQVFIGMKQPIPTPQEISIYDITVQEVGLNVLSSLMNMNPIPPGMNKSDESYPATNAPQAGAMKNSSNPSKKRKKIPYNREHAKKSGAFELTKEQQEELR